MQPIELEILRQVNITHADVCLEIMGRNRKLERIVTVNGREYKWPLKPLAVICIDGSEPEYIEKAVQAGLMPFTAQLLNTGIDLRVDCVIPSFTNPNNVSLLLDARPPCMEFVETFSMTFNQNLK